MNPNPHSEDHPSISPEDIQQCIALLNHLLAHTEDMYQIPADKRMELIVAAGKLSRPSREDFKKQKKDAKALLKRKQETRDRTARKDTGIRTAREASIFIAPKILGSEELSQKSQRELTKPQLCYICKSKYTTMHHFYDTMCPDCGDFNYAKRFQMADVSGQIAVVTGSRLKIGYHICLLLLRGGATVIATTRFPIDSALRFSKEEDFADWGHRLKIHGLDLRHIPSVEIFCNYIEQKYQRLDILINNAAQTVRRPSGFYSHLMANETQPIQSLPTAVQNLLGDHDACIRNLSALNHTTSSNENLPVTWHGAEQGIGIRASAQLSQIPYSFDKTLVEKEVFPEGELDADLQQVDLRKVNSWRLKLGQIETTEMIEVQLVNSVAPFVLCNRLSELMRTDYTGKKHIVNVTAMEGKFYINFKEDRHPHTNMAKAALNMLTHTAAGTLAKDGIFMNAVDTGWVTDEDPAELAKMKQEKMDFHPPLDIVDGAARVLDPLFDGINTGKHWCGRFLKDYKPISW